MSDREFVATDASHIEKRNGVFFIVGAVIHVSDSHKFQAEYFDFVKEFIQKHNIETRYPVLKSATIHTRIPSYKIRDASEELLNGVLDNDGIENIYIYIGWFDQDEVKVPMRTDPMRGIGFANKYLAQYFPITCLWKYQKDRQENEYRVPDKAISDNIQGKITRAWASVGSTYDVDLVPYGDETYPSLSIADIVSGLVSRYLPADKPLKRYKNISHKWITEDIGIDFYLKTDNINSSHGEHIVPDYEYPIKSERHYPHPVYFIYDEVFKDYDKSVLPETEFHDIMRRRAFKDKGCVVNLDPQRLPSIVRSDDKIVYTEGSNTKICSALQNLNPSKNLEMISSDDVLSEE